MIKKLISVVLINTIFVSSIAWAGMTAIETRKQNEELQCLALNIYFETRASSLADAMSVSDVVLNRVNSTKFPNNVCDVVYEGIEKGRHKCQFSWYCDGKSDKIPEFDIDLYNAIFTKATRMIGQYNWGNLDDMTKGSTHYHADYVYPEWRQTKTKMITIDNHIFYKWEINE